MVVIEDYMIVFIVLGVLGTVGCIMGAIYYYYSKSRYLNGVWGTGQQIPQDRRHGPGTNRSASRGATAPRRKPQSGRKTQPARNTPTTKNDQNSQVDIADIEAGRAEGVQQHRQVPLKQ